MPAPIPVYSRSVVVPVPAGIDAARFQAVVLIDRKDGRPLTKADREALAAALAALETSDDKPAAVEAPKAAPKGKSKAAKKPPAAKPRAPGKAPARKAARRPSKG